MAKVKLTSVPTQTLSYLIILGGGVILFALLAILPAHKETAALDFEIDNVNTKIEEIKIRSIRDTKEMKIRLWLASE